MQLIKRRRYLERIRPFYHVDLVKLICGVRRAGKSVLLQSIRSELLEQGVADKRIITLDLELFDNAFINSASLLNEVLEDSIRDDERHYIFIDEVQQVPDFEKVLSAVLSKYQASIFVTGSNSTLLSGELATRLTVRSVEFEVLPFSFAEVKDFFEVNHLEFKEDCFFDYLKWGGLPRRFTLPGEDAFKLYAENLFKAIVDKDIIKGDPRKKGQALRSVMLYVLANAGKSLSPEKIAQAYNSSHPTTISGRSIYHYLELMKSAFLVHPARCFYLSGKAALRSQEKYYAVDNVFRTLGTNTIDFEDTFYLENIVFNELLSRGLTVHTGKTYKSEVDFVAVKDGRKCFIQVAYLLNSEDTIYREFEAFAPIADHAPKYVLSLDKIDLSRHGITHLNLIDFLLNRKELVLT